MPSVVRRETSRREATATGMIVMQPKHFVGIGAGVLLAAGLYAQLVPSSEIKRPTATQAFMWQKLAHAQGVLEGLTLEKFDQVSRSAVQLRNMTHSNFWFVTKQVDYRANTTNFQKSVDALYMAAVDRKLDAATEAYTQMTRQCIECHRVVRADQRPVGSRPGERP